MKVITNEKHFRIIIAICVIAYFCAFFGNFFMKNNEIKAYEELYASLQQSTKEFNSQLLENNNTSNKVVEEELPLFNDAITAVDYAFNLTMGQPYETKTEGMVVANTMGITVNVKTNSTQVYFKDGSVLIETMRYEMGSNYGQTKSSFSYYTNNNRYKKLTTNVTMDSNGKLVATYNDNYEVIEDYGLPKFFKVNTNTIAKAVYFKVNRNIYTNKIESYSASVILKATLATKGYDEQVRDEGGLAALPVYKSMELNCIIGADGLIKSMNLKEQYVSQMNLFGGIAIDCSSDTNYYFTDLTKYEIQTPQPTI